MMIFFKLLSIKKPIVNTINWRYSKDQKRIEEFVVNLVRKQIPIDECPFL
ncbi:MAG: hypothetical protein ACI9SI_000061 [Polaribacter sp.]|jgi:hypothetical protein